MGSHAGELQSGELETLEIPSDGIPVKKAISMDIGGSVTKAIYTEDLGDKMRINMFSYPRRNTKEAVDHLCRAIGGPQPDGTVMDVCGVGFQEYAEHMKETVNVTVRVNEEINCFTEALRFLVSRVPLDKLVYMTKPEVVQAVPVIAGTIAGGVNALSGYGKNWDVTRGDDESHTVEYPVLLCMLGSGGGLMKVEEDGSFMVAEQLTRCGRTLLGLSKLLLGTESFTEMIELARHGDGGELHIQAKHLLHGAGDVYDVVPGDFMVYTFGQALTKDKESISREDMAAALLGMMCEDIAQSCHLTARTLNIKRIFLAGSVVGTSQHLRDQMKKDLLVRDVLNSQFERYYSNILRYAGYYGALGALFRTMTNRASIGPGGH